MRVAQELLGGLVKMGLVAAGLYYAVEILITYAKSGVQGRPGIDRQDPLGSAGRSLVWVGTLAISLAVKALRPLLDMLSEASAEIGEWALLEIRSRR